MNEALRTDIGTLLKQIAGVDDAELEAAVEIQRTRGGLLGEILVDLGACDAQDVDDARGIQDGLRGDDPNEAAVRLAQVQLERARRRNASLEAFSTLPPSDPGER